MTCEQIREALSARLDGEVTGVPDETLDSHLATCAGCASWLDGATTVTRRLRVRLAEPAGDLTQAVVAAARAAAEARRPSQRVARLMLAGVALLQIALSLPALLAGEQAAAGHHVAREIGATEIALAIGVLAAAWRPWRAAGMLPVVAALAVGLSGTTLVDVLAGRTLALHEVPHLIAIVEAALVWRLRHQGPATGGAASPPQQLRRVA